MPEPSSTHAIVIPTYNTGPKLVETVKDALSRWAPVCVVVDGSTDGSQEPVLEMARENPGLHIIEFEMNRGKGAAVLKGVEYLVEQGITHVLAMDSDGQHNPDAIVEMMELSRANPDCMILGQPIFDESAPRIRVEGRKLSNFWANVHTLWAGIHDSLFGLRVYPAVPLVKAMHSTPFARRFDFDVEVAVRLCWAQVRPLNYRTPCTYLTACEGGVSQFRYFRDNALLTWMHFRLLLEFMARSPILIYERLTRQGAFGNDRSS